MGSQGVNGGSMGVIEFLWKLVERGFSAAAQLLGKQRQSLCITERGDLRIFLSNIKPDIEKLVSSHQTHPSYGKLAGAK